MPNSNHSLIVRVLFLLLIVFFIGTPKNAQADHNNLWCASCHGEEEITGTLLDDEEISVHIDFKTYDISVHGAYEIECLDCHMGKGQYPHHGGSDLGCLKCHESAGSLIVDFNDIEIKLFYENRRSMTISLSKDCLDCHEEQADKYRDGLHSKSLENGNLDNPVCVDCHGSHNVTVPNESPRKIAEKCGECHEEELDIFMQSVHGKSLSEKEDSDAPTCTDCHGVHDNRGPDEASFKNDSIVICGECHGDEEIMDKYNISTAVLNTYLDDFHGKTAQLFQISDQEVATDKAVCFDCHGIHDILSPEDPNSHVYPENLQKTCQKCHEDASISFPKAWLSHYVPNQEDTPGLYYVNQIYPILISLTALGIGAYRFLEIFKNFSQKQWIRGFFSKLRQLLIWLGFNKNDGKKDHDKNES